MATSRSMPDHQSKHTEWMTNLPEILHNEPITKLAIPGTHDSFAFHLTRQPGPDLIPALRRLRMFIHPIIKNWSITQNKSFTGIRVDLSRDFRRLFQILVLEQLNVGIRYLDLRVCRTIDSHLHTKSPFTFTHGLLGHLVRDGLDEINQFLDKHPKEIVLIDFNHFYDFNDQCGHDQLIHLIHQVFGKKLCTTARTIHECTLNYLWTHQQQVILLYEKHADQCSAYMDRIGHFFQICESPWPNTPNVDTLFLFLDKNVREPRQTTCVNVVQGQVTPDGGSIQRNPLSSLNALAKETNGRLIEWLKERQRDPSIANGVNVVICDFADELFADTIILLNYKDI